MILYDFVSYREYLKHRLPISGEGRGQRAKLSAALRVQSAYVSRVMAGSAEFSLEQGIIINDFLGHSADEADFFMLLLQKEKAGSADLIQYFQKKIEKWRTQKREIQSRVEVKNNLPLESRVIYYSHWIYPFLHMVTRIPEFQTREKLEKLAAHPRNKIREALDWMIQTGILQLKDNRYTSLMPLLHLDRGSPLVSGFHAQWRRLALNSLDHGFEKDLFLTSPFTISKKDFERVRSMVLSLITQIDEVLIPSPDEEVVCLNIDLFKINV